MWWGRWFCHFCDVLARWWYIFYYSWLFVLLAGVRTGSTIPYSYHTSQPPTRDQILWCHQVTNIILALDNYVIGQIRGTFMRKAWASKSHSKTASSLYSGCDSNGTQYRTNLIRDWTDVDLFERKSYFEFQNLWYKSWKRSYCAIYALMLPSLRGKFGVNPFFTIG